MGGRCLWKKKLFLKRLIEEGGGTDLGYYGANYTWVNNHEGLGLIKERLDCGVANHDWITMFPKTKVFHLLKEKFDHCPILINTEGGQMRTFRPFRFFNAWTSNPTCFKVIKEA